MNWNKLNSFIPLLWLGVCRAHKYSQTWQLPHSQFNHCVKYNTNQEDTTPQIKSTYNTNWEWIRCKIQFSSNLLQFKVSIYHTSYHFQIFQSLFQISIKMRIRPFLSLLQLILWLVCGAAVQYFICHWWVLRSVSAKMMTSSLPPI